MTNKTASQGKISEFNFIDKYLRPLASRNSAGLNLADDVAIPTIEGKDSKMVVSKDIFVQNVHFLATDQPKDIASRLILSNISDIASSGAIPRYYMLGLPKRDDLMKGFYDEFCSELAEIQDLFDISLIGGDTVGVKNDLFFSVTIFGEAPLGKILKRNSAKIDDDIYVTGAIGDSFLGLQYKLSPEKFSNILNEQEIEYILDCHNRPKIHNIFTNALLLNDLSKSAIDISDGLLADLRHICQESKITGVVNLDEVPISVAARKLIDANIFTMEDLVSGGEDYRVIFTANEKHKNSIFTLANRLEIGLNCIGKMVNKKDEDIKIKDNNGKNIKLNYLGYEH